MVEKGTPSWIITATFFAICGLGAAVIGMGFYTIIESFKGECFGTPLVAVTGFFCYREIYRNDLEPARNYDFTNCSRPQYAMFAPCVNAVPSPGLPSCDDSYPAFTSLAYHIAEGQPKICLRANSSNIWAPLIPRDPEPCVPIERDERSQLIPFCRTTTHLDNFVASLEKRMDYVFSLNVSYPFCDPSGTLCV